MTDDFATFVTKVQPRLHNLALALTGGEVHEARDLVQSALERIWIRWERSQIEEPSAYARTVLIREFSTTRRRARWRREALRAEPPETRGADFTASSDSALTLLHALKVLPPRQREVVVLRYLEDLSIAQVSSLLSCTEGTVKRAAHDGLRSLRSALGEVQEGSDTHATPRS